MMLSSECECQALSSCPFCAIPTENVICETDAAIAFYDNFPLSAGHALIIPRRHVSSLFLLSDAEQVDIWQTVARVRCILQDKFSPDAFNIGVNDGRFAGQTIDHAHAHVIPRYAGDVADPRGGIRWILPATANYWDAKPC